jgi:hypothetical protein
MHRMSDLTGIIGDGLTLASVAVAAIAAKFAADSATAARETVPSMNRLAESMAESVRAAGATVGELSTLVGQARLAISEVRTARERIVQSGKQRPRRASRNLKAYLLWDGQNLGLVTISDVI